MNKTVYIKEKRKYQAVGTEAHFVGDGIYLVEQNGRSYSRVAKLGTLKKTAKFAKMAKEIPELAIYLYAIMHQKVSGTLRMDKDGSWQYQIPSTHDLASDIITFLGMDADERKRAINIAASQDTHLDSDGNVVDSVGKLLHTRYSKEAYAVKLHQLQKQVAEYEQILSEQLLDDL